MQFHLLHLDWDSAKAGRILTKEYPTPGVDWPLYRWAGLILPLQARTLSKYFLMMSLVNSTGASLVAQW